MPRPTSSIRLKTTDYGSIDIARLRRQARRVGYSGSIRWTRQGEVRALIGYTLEAAGLRLTYRVTPAGGAPEYVNERSRSSPLRCTLAAIGTGSPAPPAGAAAASS